MSSANAHTVRWTTSRGVVLRYGIAVLSTAVALGLSLLLRAFDITVTPFLMAIAVTVWYAGWGPGFLAIVLAIASIHHFLMPPSTA